MSLPSQNLRQSAAGAVAHVTLRLGRLMLVNGADAARVQAGVATLARRLGYEAQLLVLAEGLLLTLEDEHSFRTKLGHAISGMNVNMGALAALDDIVRKTATAPDIEAIDRQLDAVERADNRYPHWLVAIGMGLTAASMARLFGGVWPVVGVSVLVGIVNLLLRQRFAASSMNPIATAALVALASGLVGALAMKAFPDASPTLCLVAAGMILVPGVPLINGVRETLGSHVATGIARLTVGAITVMAIAFGLFLAASLAGGTLPVASKPALLPVGEDLLFSALAAIGFALLFNVPSKAVWACMLCGMAGHGLRTALAHMGLNLVAGSLVGALAAGLLARLLARHFKVPAITFAFPGVVAMVPGSYAFRAGIGGLGIMDAGADASLALIGDTIGLAITAILMTVAIAVGLLLALAAPFVTTSQSTDPTGAAR
jgi:uncharacterized membrane protein YjjP (DUF1212 family)